MGPTPRRLVLLAFLPVLFMGGCNLPPPIHQQAIEWGRFSLRIAIRNDKRAAVQALANVFWAPTARYRCTDEILNHAVFAGETFTCSEMGGSFWCDDGCQLTCASSGHSYGAPADTDRSGRHLIAKQTYKWTPRIVSKTP